MLYFVFKRADVYRASDNRLCSHQREPRAQPYATFLNAPQIITLPYCLLCVLAHGESTCDENPLWGKYLTVRYWLRSTHSSPRTARHKAAAGIKKFALP
jgi:hypothetical protein